MTERTETGADAIERGDAWADLAGRVRAWIADDPDPRTAAELTALLDRAEAGEPSVPGGASPEEQQAATDVRDAREDLADRFQGLLQFGTAGLRGAVEGGPHRMNRAVVIRAASGLGAYLLGELEGVSPAPKVVVGHDARHGSVDFARDTAAVLTAVGIEVVMLPPYLPTPVLAFAVRHLGADAGVMVTASHNPPKDNGYKVYLGGRVVTDSGQGAQIVPPMDGAIAAEIGRVPSVAAVPRAADGWSTVGPEIVDAYVAEVLGLADLSDEARARHAALRVVLTPMHGVGGGTARRVLAEAGFTDVHVVALQAEPDPDFPTVAFPNPEEPGAIDLAVALAAEVQADLVIALDPDADRCGAAVIDPRMRTHMSAGAAGSDGWRMLHGDETGALLGSVAASRLGTTGAPVAADAPVLANSIVSSRLLGRIAAHAGLRHAQTLTGFKWISRVEGLVYGYEEALGYCVDPAHVRDKDGISAALTLAGLAARLKAEGRAPVDVLDDLARQHGLHLTDQLSARFTDLSQIPETMQRLREHPPVVLAGSPVLTVVDLAAGSDADRDGLPPTDGIRLLTQDDTRVIVRPSGTEPKVKCYLEVVVPVEEHASDASVGQARVAARARLDAVRADVAAALGLV
ncbi:phospho-sugar mutase [Cellulomonas sp. IC4_254]|uniref:phospho-sugar mutase n=1 Tax=Cellulomonas sp. IC4_254 TaxID=2714040 RepID=UPI00141E7D32|nr:phospho-sugar mutase [Cellulomonas sp. IC4_254]NHT17772.1 phospho-sugar mutase [Cellulomonas sp. IC4_254]